MKYWIWLRGRGGEAVLFEGETPETVRPELIAHTKSDFVEKRLKLCKDCQGDHPHVIREPDGSKYCPILFSDAVKPGWTARHLLTGLDGGDEFDQHKEIKEAVMEQVIAFKVSEVRAGANYRKSGDKAKQAELNASVKEHGVLTPIWVRKNGNGFLIIAGERRHKAAIAAGLVEIPGILKEATDEQALELSVIENDQREDVNPMEQAMGYKDLLDKGKHTPETLALKLGRRLPSVLGLLKLLSIPKEAQKALLEGKIEYGHALLITRLKNNGDQKAFLDEILEDMDGVLSVTQAKDKLDDYTLKLASAAFDAQGCATCTFRSKAQAGLFPEAAKAQDQCMDKSCFFTKTREHYQKLGKEMEAKGLKVLTSAKQVQAARNAPNSCEISPDERSYTHPKKYKSMCVTCEKRTVSFYEADGYSGRKEFHTGEICMDKKCFNKMNGRGDQGQTSGASYHRPRSNASREHALAMRDRFLRARMPAKVEANEILQRRLVLFHLLCRFDGFSTFGKPELVKMDHDKILAEILREHCPTWKHDPRMDEQKLFAAVSMVPAVSIAAVTRKAILASVPFTTADVLLQGMGEAGLKMEKDFQVDEAFLNTKTKAELRDMAKAFSLEAWNTIDSYKKPEGIKEIMKQRLIGKVPAEVAKECKVITLGSAKAKVKAKKGNGKA